MTPSNLSALQPISRVLAAAIFVVSGLTKLGALAGTQAYMAAYGVPAPLVYPVVALEVGGGLALAAGWHTRMAALALAAFTFLAGAIFHHDASDQIQVIMMLKNLAMVGGLLAIAAQTRPAYGLDGWLNRAPAPHAAE